MATTSERTRLAPYVEERHSALLSTVASTRNNIINNSPYAEYTSQDANTAILGIGYAIGKGFASAGADVVLASRNLSEAHEAADSLKVYKIKSAGICADVSSVSQCREAVNKAIKILGHIDILVNNAAFCPCIPSLEVAEDLWDKVLNTNIKGTFF